jgi:histidyl-tRNA synthetase
MGSFTKVERTIIDKLRSLGYSVNFSYKPSGLSKQLKEASFQSVKKCIIIGYDEIQADKITVKDMSTGQQQTVPLKDFLEDPEKS